MVMDIQIALRHPKWISFNRLNWIWDLVNIPWSMFERPANAAKQTSAAIGSRELESELLKNAPPRDVFAAPGYGAC
jgi:hypothetical protein